MKIIDYITPKSLVYSGKHTQKETVIRHFQYNENELIESNDLKRRNGYKSYIQVIGLNDVEKIKEIQQLHQIDDLIIEDILNVAQGEKIDVMENYLFSVIHALFYVNNQFIKEYMSMICLENTVITFHEDDPWFLDASIDTLKEYKALRKKTSDFLFYQIMDLITDNHIEVFNHLSSVINEFEDITLNDNNLPQEEFYRVRKSFVRLKNNVYYLLEALNRLLKKSHHLIQKDNIEYYNDLIDHLSRLDGQVNLSRENLRNLVDVNINNQSNRMNQIMTTLTLFSAIFIPLSFLTGFFGMNFVHFEVLSYQNAVWIFILFCVLLIVFMIWFFKHKKWL
jgi:magnesium transporter